MTVRNFLPEAEVLNLLLSYDPSTGLLIWRHNCLPFGTPRKGYVAGVIDGKRYYAHRLIYKMMTGREPSAVIDHVDGNRSNNAWFNIRSCDSSTNSRNLSMPTHNTTGRVGVSRDPNGRFRAHICINKRRITLGRFDTFEAAASARSAAEAKYGFHKNHGRTSANPWRE